MANRHRYNLDDLPPLLLMDEDAACQFPSGNHGQLSNERKVYTLKAEVGLSKNVEFHSLKRPYESKNNSRTDFCLPVSSNTMESLNPSPSSESTLKKHINSYFSEPETNSPPTRRKRPQECTRCANHDISVPMKGHKHYCPYANCSCDLCEVTQKKNYYSKMHQKLNRHRRGHEKIPQFDTTTFTPEIMYRNFPESRRQELVQDLNNTELNFLEEIKGLCVP